MKLFSCLLLFLCPYFSNAQPLRVGDTMPDIAFANLVNYTTTNATLSSFKGKLVLLDFWATWCSACLHKFDKLDSLQTKYKGNLQVLLVNTTSTGDTKEKVQQLLQRFTTTNGKRLRLPSVVKDSIADRLFPHKLLPHYVWLDGNRKVLAITGGDAVIDDNIEQVLAGKNLSFIGKEDNTDFDRKQPLFVNGNGGSGNNFKYRSLLTPYTRGLSSGSFIAKTSNGLVNRISITNMPILLLLQQAYQVALPSNRMVFDLPDSMDLRYKNKDENWLISNSFCYELSVPYCSLTQLYSYMQQDLERYFGLSALMQKRETDCYVLTVDTSLLLKAKTKNGTPINRLYEAVDRQMVNRPIATLSGYLNSVLEHPVLDSTNIPYNLDINLPDGNIRNIHALQQVLAPYGIYLTTEKREVEQFIISITKTKTPLP